MVLLFACCAAAFAHVGLNHAEASAPRYGILDGDSVLMCGSLSSCGKRVSLAGGGSLVVFRCEERGDRRNHCTPILVEWHGPRQPPLAWDFRDGLLHVAQFWPLIPTAGMRAGQIVRVPLTAAALYPSLSATRGAGPGSEATFRQLVEPRDKLGPLDGAFMKCATGSRGGIHFSFRAASDREYHLYVLADQTITRWGSCRRAGQAVGGWIHEGAWRSPFCEPFRVLTNGETVSFVTASGLLYTAPDTGSSGTELKKIETDSRVTAIVKEPKSGKTYLFTSRRFFALGRESQSRPFTPTKSDADDIERSCQLLSDCADAIRKLRLASASPTR